jgi:hypothetical protein
MVDPIEKSLRQWHYPNCTINNSNNTHDLCAHRMGEQIELMHLEYKILIGKYRDQSAEITRLERLNNG